MKFREHGTGKPVLTFEDRAGLVAFLREQFAHWPHLDRIDPARLRSEPIGILNKGQGGAGWTGKIWMVTVPEYGVVGYADEAL